MPKAKILVIGPPLTGKSCFSNFISELKEVNLTEWTSGAGDAKYRPTKGARVLEFQLPNVTIGKATVTIDLELWDVAGARQYESSWPAIVRDTTGIVFFSGGGSATDTEANDMYRYFAEKCDVVLDTQCVHAVTSSSPKMAYLKNVPQLVLKHLERDNGNNVRTEFQAFVLRAMDAAKRKSDNEERQFLEE